MKSQKLPCFFYPTKTILIDDDQIFLENLPINLNENLCYKGFVDPQEALIYLKTNQNNAPISCDILHSLTEISDDNIQQGKHTIHIDLSIIHNKIYDKQRFSIPTVVVVDHDMPGMTGIEFCSKLHDLPIKKVMLTGIKDHKIAIKAFNEGIIHKFIMKDDPNVFEAIDKAIADMQRDYFSDLSEFFVKSIPKSSFSFLNNDHFVRFFQEFLNKNYITEFYLIDPIGSFLLLNSEGKLSWLIVKSDQDIHSDYQIAIDQNAPHEIINSLEKRIKLLFLFSENDHRQPVVTWNAFLHPAHQIENVDGLYYTVIENDNAYYVSGIIKEKIYSYYEYTNTITD